MVENEECENILHICAKNSVSEELFRDIWKIKGLNKEQLLMKLDSNNDSPVILAVRHKTKWSFDEMIKCIPTINDSNFVQSVITNLFFEVCELGDLNFFESVMNLHEKLRINNSDHHDEILLRRNQKGYTCLHVAVENSKSSLENINLLVELPGVAPDYFILTYRK